MRKYLFVGLLVAASLLAWLYVKLGGTETLDFTQINDITWRFAGERIVTRSGDPKIEDLFYKARAYALNNEGYYLAVVNKPAGEDSVDQTIGIVSLQPFDKSFGAMQDTLKLEGDFVKAVINAHNLVMPKPDEVKIQALLFAHAQGHQVDDSYTLEIYKNERDLEVFIPLAH